MRFIRLAPTPMPPHSLAQNDVGGLAMKHELNFWVIGGDMRQAKLAQLLAKDGHTVHTYALDPGPELIPGLIEEENLNHAFRADCVILPLTVSAESGLLNAPSPCRSTPWPPSWTASLCGSSCAEAGWTRRPRPWPRSGDWSSTTTSRGRSWR